MSWVSEAANDAKLLASAQSQEQNLIATYGLSQRFDWRNKCLELINALALAQFNQCKVIKAHFANAYSMAHGSVLLTEGLLQNIYNDDQLAHILAHEHAHLTLNHHQQAAQLVQNPPKLFTKSRINKFYRYIEQQADLTADEWLSAHDRDPLQIHHYLLRIEQSTDEHSNDHRKLKHRIHRKGLPIEVKEVFWSNK